jgi:hypothetical protein
MSLPLEECETKFQALSFESGFACSTTFFVALYQYLQYRKKETFIARVPFYASLTWFINQIFWSSANANLGPIYGQVFGTTANFLDFSTKVQVIYYVCFRVAIIQQIDKALKLTLFSLILFGVLFSAVSTVFLTLEFFLVEPKMEYIYLMIYLSSDVYISFAEIMSLAIYIRYKFNLSSYKEVWGAIVDCEIQEIALVMLFFALLTVLYIPFSLLQVDNHMMINPILCAVRYALTCNSASAVYAITLRRNGSFNGKRRESTDDKIRKLEIPKIEIQKSPFLTVDT